MCLHDTDTMKIRMQHLLEVGTTTQIAVLIGTDAKDNYLTGWFVSVTDRQNIANVGNDLTKWHTAIKKLNFKHVNEKRAQFNLPELTFDLLPDVDRPMQRHYEAEEVMEILENETYPTEEMALARVE